MPHLSLFSFILYAVVGFLALSCAGARAVKRSSPPITLPFVRRMNTTGIKNLLHVDQERVKALKARAKHNTTSAPFLMSRSDDLPATDEVVDYVASIGIGNPPTNCECSSSTYTSTFDDCWDY